MANCHSSHSVDDSVQDKGLSTVNIQSTHQLQQLLQDLEGLPVKPPSIYLHASGVGKGELNNLQVLLPPKNKLYVVDVRCLDTTVMSTPIDNGGSLHAILESRSIPKVGFDIRNMSRLLFSQLNISLGNIYDLQLMELASRDEAQSKKFLSGLSKCVDQDIPDSNIVKSRWLQLSRQSPRHIQIFPALWAVYRRKLGVPGELVWLHFARAESRERVLKSKESPGTQNRQYLGPEYWWDREQKEASIEDWNDTLLMELRVGHWKINEDAEWVPTYVGGKGYDQY